MKNPFATPKGGRPSSYKPEYITEAYGLCLLGATDKELADAFNVATSTLYEWKKLFPEFSESIRRGKIPADIEVATALLERAKGAEWVEEQAIKLKRVEYDNGKRVLEAERVEVVEVTRRSPPDTTAMVFWLKNRRSGHWRDKVETDVTSGGKPIEPQIVIWAGQKIAI